MNGCSQCRRVLCLPGVYPMLFLRNRIPDLALGSALVNPMAIQFRRPEFAGGFSMSVMA